MIEYSTYSTKNESYFDGARFDYVNQLPENPSATILEIGCSNGNTGALALGQNKCGEYIGIEMHGEAAKIASEKITEVLVGDVETMILPWEENKFDVLILSEVLEHLVDPWKALGKLHRYLKPGALVFASSPNVCHYRIILMLLGGKWKLTEEGVMDKTHLRWFTPSTFSEMFEISGYKVTAVEPVTPFRFKSKLLIALLFGKGTHLFIKQINLKAIKV